MPRTMKPSNLDRTCPDCGKPFTAVHENQKKCVECLKIQNEKVKEGLKKPAKTEPAQKRASRKPKYLPARFCDNCGLEYNPTRKDSRYCPECSGARAPERFAPDKSGTAKCVVCGEEFETTDISKAKYCSDKCKSKTRTKEFRDKKEAVSDNQKMVWVKCQNPECPNGGKFQTTWQKYRSGAKYCDRDCRNTANRLKGERYKKEQEAKRAGDYEGPIIKIDYEPHSGGQWDVHNSTARFKVLICGTRWGKDRCSINEFIVKFAQMLNEKRSSNLIPKVHGWLVAPTYPLAKQLWRELCHFWPEEWRIGKNEAEHQIETIAGGLIEVKSADNPDSLVSVGLDIILMTEAARVKNLELTWSYLRGRLSSPGRGPNGAGGCALLNSCVTADTLLFTENGIREIGELSKLREQGEFENLNLKVDGVAGEPQVASDFYCNGMAETRKIVTRAGYEINGTLNHPIWAMNKDGNPGWKQLGDLEIGDYVAIRRGMDSWGKDIDLSGFVYDNYRQRPKNHGEDVDLSEMTPDLAYLMGLLLGDGYIDFDQGRIVVSHSETEEETKEFLFSYPHKLQFKKIDGMHTMACSKKFSRFLEWYGFKPRALAKQKTIPHRLFLAPKWVISNFLSGLFDSDGHARARRGIVGFTSTSKRLIEQVQFILLNFGIISRVTHCIVKPTKKVKVQSEIWQLHLSPRDSAIFYEQIGFRLTRKQEKLKINQLTKRSSSQDGLPLQSNKIAEIIKQSYRKRRKNKMYGVSPLKSYTVVGYDTFRRFLDCYPHSEAKNELAELESMYKENYFWDQVKITTGDTAETFDLVVPTTHAFVSNGFISHNTPKGRTYLYQMYQWGYDDNYPDWQSFQFPTSSNPYIDPKEIEEARKTLPERLFRQEYLGEFLEDAGEVFPNVDTVSVGVMQEPEPGKFFKASWDPALKVDYSSFGIRNERGEQVYGVRWTGVPWTIQINHIEALCKKYNNAHLDMDITGLGETLPEAIAQRGVSVTGHFLTNALKEQLVSHLALLFENRDIVTLDDRAQKDELKAFTYDYTKTGKISYHAPVGGHDDTVTMLMLLYMDYNTLSQEIPYMGIFLGAKKGAHAEKLPVYKQSILV